MCFNLNCNIFILFRVIFFFIYCSYLDKEFQSIWRFHLREIFTLSPRWIIGSCGQVVSRSQFCHYSLKYAPDKHVVISTGWKAIFFQYMWKTGDQVQKEHFEFWVVKSQWIHFSIWRFEISSYAISSYATLKYEPQEEIFLIFIFLFVNLVFISNSAIFNQKSHKQKKHTMLKKSKTSIEKIFKFLSMAETQSVDRGTNWLYVHFFIHTASLNIISNVT